MARSYTALLMHVPGLRALVKIKYPTMRVPLRHVSKAREGRILFCIRPTSNAAGVDAAVPEWIVYLDQGP
jgi:hypothetical protein